MLLRLFCGDACILPLSKAEMHVFMKRLNMGTRVADLS
jgi:hypothetical protein